MKPITLFPLVATAIFIGALFSLDVRSSDDHGSHEHEEHDEERGPHGGRLLSDGDLDVELVVFEMGIPPEFHVYAYDDGTPIDPDDFDVNVTLGRLGGEREEFQFVAERDYRRGEGLVKEPHSFDVEVRAKHSGKQSVWSYESHEGRTSIPERVAQTAGIAVAKVGAAQIVERMSLTGTVQANPAQISEVRTRFPGIVRQVRRDVGEIVKQGDVLAEVESNESLRTFAVRAPLSGLIVDRDVQSGQVTADEPLFVIANLDQVWVQLDVFGRDLPKVAVGQAVDVETLDGKVAMGAIDWISPLVSHGSQSVRARVVLDNTAGHFRPGQFIKARVAVATADVNLAVKRSGLQKFRDFDVVFARIGDTYEVRMLELGRYDDVHIEVLGGIKAGDTYVTENSYLIKADIEKSGASHDH